MNVRGTELPGVRLIEPDRFDDDRGWFMELWNEERYRAAGIEARIVQTNVSSSQPGVLRGLHYQAPDEQAKLVSVLAGSVFDVVVDIRPGSATFARWLGCELSHANRRQLWIPAGFAHGFLVTSSDPAIVAYGATAAYSASADRVIAWNDPDIGVDWPAQPSLLSRKDASAPRLARVPRTHLPTPVRIGSTT